MKKLQFKCELLSDVILNVKSASEGNNETLDFIPGGNFLGIVAGALYQVNDPDVMEIVHSGKVRFGDAHPAEKNIRTLKVPADMFYPKLSSPTEQCYLHHAYDRKQDVKDHGTAMQLKQCRNGFYAFDAGIGIPSVTGKSFSIKSAYDSKNRKSKDESMFGYESLNSGISLYFEVEVENDSLVSKVIDNLVGEKHIGRSRSAQYGSVKIDECQFIQPGSKETTGDCMVIYADSRLIFLDSDSGLPFFQPSIKDLGLSSGEIDWTKSQIRTFQYSPWNSTRQSFDTDRCGIEKGSVIVIKGCSDTGLESRYVGSYKNEGFGKVIYNPEFLEVADDAVNGEAKFKLAKPESEVNELNPENNPLTGTLLLGYVAKAKSISESQDKVYRLVNDFVDNHGRRFKADAFASQWGAIRSIASTCHSYQELNHKLFYYSDNKDERHGYLKHGVGQKKWESGKKSTIFGNWIKTVNEECPDMIIEAVVNLAAEMAKICKSK